MKSDKRKIKTDKINVSLHGRKLSLDSQMPSHTHWSKMKLHTLGIPKTPDEAVCELWAVLKSLVKPLVPLGIRNE